jgi:hypothetical protein
MNIKEMKFTLIFFGQTYSIGRHGQQVDFRHCWGNIEKMLIKPLQQQGHDIKIMASTYPFDDKDVEKDFYNMVKPYKVQFSDFTNSNKSTTKCASFDLIENEDDVILLTRFDIHFKKEFPFHFVDTNKFNFLNPEGNLWWKTSQYTNDNLYIWSNSFTSLVKKALFECRFDRQYLDTHALYKYLIKYITIDNIHFISNLEEWSGDTSLYSLCIPDVLWKNDVEPEVRKRFQSFYDNSFDEQTKKNFSTYR